MDKKIQDLAWRVLPAEFREEVKKIWSVEVDCANKYKSEIHKHRTGLLYELFGDHLHWQNNLTSDAEGEVELLRVTRQKVMGLYANAKKIHDLYTSATCINTKESQQIDICKGIMSVLDTLFGSKCLPDEACNIASSDVASPEPKSAEPKFRKDEKVRIKGVAGFDVIESIYGTDKEGYRYKLVDETAFYDESDLEPYTEPKKEYRNLSQDTANCDKQFDNILKDSFSKERRLNIAAMAMQELLANTALYEHKIKEGLMCKSNDNPIQFIPMLALKYTDALIAESEKGGEK